jgi:HEAT repeat protein
MKRVVPEPQPPEDLVAPELRPLVRQLSSELPFAVARAARELGKKGHADAVVPLIRQLGTKQRSILFAVFEALIALGSPSIGPLLEALQTERDPVVRERMALLLDQLERLAKGLPLVPTSDLFPLPSGIVDEISREFNRE